MITSGGASGSGVGGSSGTGAGRDGGEAGEGGRGESGSGPGDEGGSGGETAPAGRGGGGGVGNVGGGAGEAGLGGEAGAPLPPDTEPPYVVSVSPADGAKGVREDAEIVFTFSEPMNTTEVERAYESEKLPAESVTFSWSTDGTVLTVHPNEPLELGSGLAGEMRPSIHSTTITKVARDLAGNRMTADFTASFETLRKLLYSLPIEIFRRIKHPEVGADTTGGACDYPSDSMGVGDSNNNNGYAGLFTFSSADVPAVERPEDLMGVTLSFSYTEPQDELGALHAYRLRVDPYDATWTSPLLEDFLLASSPVSVDVTEGFLTELEERTDDRVQYLVRHDDASNGDSQEDSILIPCSSIQLRMSYWGP